MQAAVEAVGARLDHHADDAAAIAAIFGGVIAGEQLEFRDGIGIGIEMLLLSNRSLFCPPSSK